jgi:hypothetical protein
VKKRSKIIQEQEAQEAKQATTFVSQAQSINLHNKHSRMQMINKKIKAEGEREKEAERVKTD